ncbi:hypothetical protein [Bathymodiolus thermophilus thioautotrophic gill symbiont]|uniref:Porin domain-containing protein n=1 Tax=Bathymodiolus thermophilus thioautotrophic gill symbiont TaxID=2360 RepID=A0A1J5U9D5_9GAMM|nr:hypothetical protein [Bathymodiolus thermophilus thioautotrophic gill symbiont]OIR25454.1 hypothetical protein BGC33_06675 [Bathymodiolus thermophilus thioautotrophic gill symbiont]
MKKQLMIAAVAATMASVSQAGISITGDSYFSYANNAIDNSEKDANNNSTLEKNADNQRVRLKVVGTTGATKVTAVIRNASQTRVDGDPKSDDKGRGLHMDSLYITTKAGRFNIKAGDYWETTGLGARFKGVGKRNAVSLSTKLGPVKVGVFTQNGSQNASGNFFNKPSTNVNASAKIKGVAIKAVLNPKEFTNLSVKGTFKGITGALELHLDKTNDAIVDDEKNNTTLIHVNGKFRSVKWDVASISNKIAYEGHKTTGGFKNGSLAPLGSMLIGKGARGGTATAVADVGQFTSIVGVAVGTKLLGNTIKGIYTTNKMLLNAVEEKVSGIELIVTRPLGGAQLTANFGKLSGFGDTNEVMNASNKGLRLDVKF